MLNLSSASDGSWGFRRTSILVRNWFKKHKQIAGNVFHDCNKFYF